ncbi:MAG: phosphotransferase [Acidimicrobiia bacterium]
MADQQRIELALQRCRASVTGWAEVPVEAFTWDAPKGFSSFTLGIHRKGEAGPDSVLYRSLEGKENAILDPVQEREVFLLLGEHDIAAKCLAYQRDFRIEAFYDGRSLTRHDLADHGVLSGIAAELHRMHRIEPAGLPDDTFFELLHTKWRQLGLPVVTSKRSELPPDEREMCDELVAMYTEEAAAMVGDFLPNSATTFCHNDTYHGNVMKLDDGAIKLLDFEFSCRNHPAFDFANLFAETVTRHGLDEPPHFTIVDPEYTVEQIEALVTDYVTLSQLDDDSRTSETERLVAETVRMIPLSDYMYAMAAVPLALDPVQKIRFIPYAHARWNRFRRAHNDRFG